MSDFVKVPSMFEPTVPLSVLSLDLSEPGNGWPAYLAERDINITLDHLGRAAIAQADARRLFDEHREDEVRAREAAARNEQAAVERDQAWRASLPRGIPWHRMPDAGLLPAAVMLQQAKDAEPRRTPTRGEWLFGEADTMVYHELPQGAES